MIHCISKAPLRTVLTRAVGLEGRATFRLSLTTDERPEEQRRLLR